MEVSAKSLAWRRSAYNQDLDQMADETVQYEHSARQDWPSAEGCRPQRASVESNYADTRSSAYETNPYRYGRNDSTWEEDARVSEYETRPSYSYGRSGGLNDCESTFIRKRNDELSQRKYPDNSEYLSPMQIRSRRYHQHEEDETDFRSQFMKDLSHQQDNSYTGIPQQEDQAIGSRHREPSPSYSKVSHSQFNDGDLHNDGQHQEDVGTGTQLSHSGESTGYASGMMQIVSPEKKPSAFDHEAITKSVIKSSGSPSGDIYKHHQDADDSDEDEEDYDLEGDEDLEEEYHLEEPDPDDSWHREIDCGVKDLEASSSTADWKRPDMHMFKTSSYKGSVTSEKSSRVDPHTYQSYTAGLLHSSGRSETFLKLQKNYAILERIGELDKTPSSKPKHLPLDSGAKWKEFENSGFASGQDFQSKEELQELYSELEEAKKNKEFYHDTDRAAQFQWSPQKEFGFNKGKQTLKERVRSYGNLIEDSKTAKSSVTSPIQNESIKRAVSFGALYEKFGGSSASHHRKEYSDANQMRRSSEYNTAELACFDSGDSRTASDQQRYSERKGAFSDERENKAGKQKHNRFEEDAKDVHGNYGDRQPHPMDSVGRRYEKSSSTFSDEHYGAGTRRETQLQCMSPEQAHSKQEELHSQEYFSPVEEEFKGRSSKDFPSARNPVSAVGNDESPQKYHQRFGDWDQTENLPSSGKRLEEASKSANKSEPSRQYTAMATRQTADCESFDPQQSKPCTREMSYLQLMDIAAKKSRQRAIHGTHMDPPRNEYEVYVEELKKMAKADADAGNLHIRSMSAPHPALKQPSFTTLPRSESSKESFFGMDEPATSSETASTASATSKTFGVSPEIVVDSSTAPREGLRVNFETGSPAERKEYGKPSVAPAAPVRQTFSSSPVQNNDFSFNSLARLPKDRNYDPTDSSDAADFEVRSVRRQYAEMPDIIRVEKHYDHFRRATPESPHSTDITPRDNDNHKSQNTSSPGLVSENTGVKENDAGRFSGAENWKESFCPEHHSIPHSRANPPNHDGKGTVFRVTNLRSLASNNEFSANQLPWMKKSASSSERDFGQRPREPPVHVQTLALHKPLVSSKSAPSLDSYSHFEASQKKHDSRVPERRNIPPEEAVSAYKQVVQPQQTSVYLPAPEKKVPPAVPPKKPSSLSIKPKPSQSGPSFSSSMRGTQSRSGQGENTQHAAGIVFENALPQNKGSLRLADPPHRQIDRQEPSVSLAGGSTRRAEIVFVNALPQSKEDPSFTEYPHSRNHRESESRATDRQPGDGNDAASSGPDKQYGQLRKWTAVADIYRDVEKSWSPTRETRPFPPDNNSSISSTDTFIVKDTDEEESEEDNMESSGASVSQLREIFERRQKVNKSKSEPDLSTDSGDEPRRPRSAKSQTGLNSLRDDEEPPQSGLTRTVSSDLAELRQKYGLVSDVGPNVQAGQTSPTDTALRAWMEYTGRGRYDPYLPPEDILKEVSAVSSGRKLDVPRKKDHRPSNVSKMTLEYFDQIGSEWQHGNVRGSAFHHRPYTASQEHQYPQVQRGTVYEARSLAQASLEPNNRRNVSHQYVNEEAAFSMNYPQTDDLKLKQSQMAGTAQFAGGPHQHQPQRTFSFQSASSSHSIPRRGSLRTAVEAGNHGLSAHQAHPQVPTIRPRSHLTDTLTPESRSQLPETPTARPRSQPEEKVTVNSQPSETPPIRPRSQLISTSSHIISQQEDQNQTSVRENFATHNQRSQKNLDHQHQRKSPGEFPQHHIVKAVPPEPVRLPPVSPKSPQRQPHPQPRELQHRHSKSSDSEHSSGDYGGVYCVSTGSVWYGAEAEEATEPPVPPPPQTHSSLASSSQTFPRNPAARQPFLQQTLQGGQNPVIPPQPTPRKNLPYSSATLGRNTSAGTAPAPPTRGGSGGISGAGTLPRAKTSTPHGSSLSAVEQLGVKSPPPSAGFGSAASTGYGGSNPIPSARAFKHQTSDTRRPRPEPANPEKERRRREEEEAYRKKRLEELYEEERQRKMKKDEVDAEARRHHDYYLSSQKSPISPNRFDDSSSAPLSPSQPGSLGTLERKDQQLSVPPERRRGFQIQGKAKALYNFNAQNPRELSFRKNDVLYLLRQVDKNWFEGERHGRVGIFPTNYVEVVTSIEAAKAAAMQAEGQGRAKYTFTAQSSVELSLRKGEFVVLLRRVDDNWYEGRIGNRQGIFPINYVEITREPSTPLITPAPSVITTPMTGTPEMLSPVGYDPAPTPPPQPSPSAFTSQRSPTANYGYRQPQQQNFFGSGSAPLLAPASSVSRHQINLSRQEPDLSNPKSPVSNAKSPISPGGRLGSPGQMKKGSSPGPAPVLSPAANLQIDIHSKAKAKPYANGQAKSNKVADDDLAVTRYRALYAYRPQNEDELELRDGDEVFVMEKCDDGWFVGTSARTGCFGTFPGNYVQKICKFCTRKCKSRMKLKSKLEGKCKKRVLRERLKNSNSEPHSGSTRFPA